VPDFARQGGLVVRRPATPVSSGKKQLWVFNTCKNNLDEFNSYRYDPEKMKEEPIKENDHLMDALRYAVHNYGSKGFSMPGPTRVKIRIG
jgi:hypothetical protein